MLFKNNLIAFISLFLTITWNSYAQLPVLGNYSVQVFDNTPVRFSSEDYPGSYNEPAADGVIRLTNGRIILKKIETPAYSRNVKVELTVQVASAGDRWDKSGSCFVLPKQSAVNLLTIAQEKAVFPAIDSTLLENMRGIVPDAGYQPTIELMRFITPFGVGFYSSDTDSLSSKRKPNYIDEWAQYVKWEQDITDLYSLLEGEAYVGIFIDTWTTEGYTASMKLDFEESKLACDPLPRRHVEPLMNTVYYIGQEYPDIFSQKDVSVDFTVPVNAKNVRLKYITTGHGGHAAGDEFVKKTKHCFNRWPRS